jgi:hypothetical protein
MIKVKLKLSLSLTEPLAMKSRLYLTKRESMKTYEYREIFARR